MVTYAHAHKHFNNKFACCCLSCNPLLVSVRLSSSPSSPSLGQLQLVEPGAGRRPAVLLQRRDPAGVPQRLAVQHPGPHPALHAHLLPLRPGRRRGGPRVPGLRLRRRETVLIVHWSTMILLALSAGSSDYHWSRRIR
jgi:hypothetical protein